MSRFRVDIAYFGEPFQGWQIQPEGLTVQGALNEALSKVLRQTTQLVGAGRTDSGVHAKGQVAHFDCDEDFDVAKLHHAINGLTPREIKVLKIEKVDESFHARFSPHIKAYRYQFDASDFADPFLLKTHYYCKTYRNLDRGCMTSFLKGLVGTHDFASYCSIQNSTETTVRTLESLELEGEIDGVFSMEAKGKGFLQHMIRIIAGTLLVVGTKSLSLEQAHQALQGKGYRDQLGPTLPSHGLTLEKTEYL